jgi:hypothetical protein
MQTYFYIDIKKAAKAISVFRQGFAKKIQIISAFFSLNSLTTLLVQFLMLKHGSLTQLEEGNYSNELLVVYISIAWKFCEYKTFSLDEIIQGIFSDKILTYGNKFYQKVKRTVVEYESVVLRDLDY